MRPQKSAARIVLEPLAIAIVLALAARSAFRVFSIPSNSMAPTLQPGDVVLVTPYRLGEPATGDVVVFRNPGSDELLIKRVVATSGEMVEGQEGHLIVGGHARIEPYVAPGAATEAVPSQLIPAGSYFVMGDNRTDSLDSRRFGPIPRELIIGRARLVIWSFETAHAYPAAIPPATPDARGQFRLNRIFKCIE